jgi:hypothetical protein
MTILEQFIGTWRVIEDPFNPDDETFYAFDSANHLTMTFRTKTGTQYILLTYRLDGDTLVTDQPSAPKIEKATVDIDGDTMTIDHEGAVTRLKRVS